MESKGLRLLAQIHTQSSSVGYTVTKVQFADLKVCLQRNQAISLLADQVKSLREAHESLLAKFTEETAEMLILFKTVSTETSAQVTALTATMQEMMKFIDREIRKALKPVIPTSIIISNLQYPAINDLSDLDSPKHHQSSIEVQPESRPDSKPGSKDEVKPPQSKQMEASGKTDHIQLLIATLEALGKDLMKLRNVLHAFYYKVGGKPQDKPHDHTDSVPSIWGDAEIIDGGVSPLGASLAPGFSFTKAAYTEDLRNVMNVGDQDLFSQSQKSRLVAGILSIVHHRENPNLPSSARRDIKQAVEKGHFKLDLDNTVLRKCVATDELPITIREKLVYEYINSSRQSARRSVTIEELLNAKKTNRPETDSSALPSLDGLESVTPKNRKEFEVSAASYTNALFSKQQDPLCLSPEELPEQPEPLNSSLASTIDEKMEEKRRCEAKQRLPGLWGPDPSIVGSVFLPPIGASKQPEKRLKRSVSNVPPKLHGRKPRALPKVVPKDPKKRMKRVNSVESDVIRGRGKHKAVKSVSEDSISM